MFLYDESQPGPGRPRRHPGIWHTSPCWHQDELKRNRSSSFLSMKHLVHWHHTWKGERSWVEHLHEHSLVSSILREYYFSCCLNLYPSFWNAKEGGQEVHDIWPVIQRHVTPELIDWAKTHLDHASDDRRRAWRAQHVSFRLEKMLRSVRPRQAKAWHRWNPSTGTESNLHGFTHLECGMCRFVWTEQLPSAHSSQALFGQTIHDLETGEAWVVARSNFLMSSHRRESVVQNTLLDY